MRIDAGTQRADSMFEVKWSDGPFDHPAEIKEAVNFAERNGLNQMVVTSRSQEGVKRVGQVELTYVSTSRFAYNLGRELLAK